MNETKEPILLSDIKENGIDGRGNHVDVFNVSDEYRVVFEASNHLIVRIGARYFTPAASFDHEHLLAKVTGVAERKSQRKDGSKRYYSHVVIWYYFAIPKSKITYLPGKGFSYVEVKIGDLDFIINASGGTTVGPGSSSGWSDYVSKSVDLGYGCRLKDLKTLARESMSLGECLDANIKIEPPEMTGHDKLLFEEKVYRKATLSNLKEGDEILLLQVPDKYGFRQKRIDKDISSKYFFSGWLRGGKSIHFTSDAKFPGAVDVNLVITQGTAQINNLEEVTPEDENRLKDFMHGRADSGD